MRTLALPYDPEGAALFFEDDEAWYPALCPLCGQGFLDEQRGSGGYMYTCWHPRHPMYCCHTQFWVEDGLDYGTFEASVKHLRELGVLD